MRTSTRVQSFSTAVLLTVCAAPAAGCGMATPPEPTFPQARWGQQFAFSYETPPALAPGSVDATIIVVDTEFWKTDVFDQPSYKALGDGLSKSMGVDLQKIVIAKGMTALGPYASYDEVVYSDKKNATLMLAPMLEMKVEVTYHGPETQVSGINHARQHETRMSRDFTMNVTGYLSLIMAESLSREKMWLKKLELGQQTMNGVEQWKAVPEYQPTYGFFGEKTGQKITGYHKGEMIYDGKPEVLADAVSSIYQTLMQKCWKLVDSQEVVDLKATAKEIRDRATYQAKPSG